jgi:hypothetical protein
LSYRATEALVLLFISYASEDEVDFAEPLARELSKDNEIWFARHTLKAGDSLLTQINEGLLKCDYGVVIMSHHFFAKKWPTSELNGLFALEEPSRKLILPVWRGLTPEDVKRYSPILADRVAADGSSVESAAADLRFAIKASDRQQLLSGLDKSIRGFSSLSETVEQRRNNERLLTTEEGRALIVTATKRLFDLVQTTVNGHISSSAQAFKFQCKRDDSEFIRVDSSYRLSLHFSLHLPYINSAGNCRLRVAVYRDNDRFGRASGIASNDWEMLTTDEYIPFIRISREVVWQQDSAELMKAEQVAANGFESLLAALKEAALHGPS